MEQTFLSKTPYINAEQISIADLLAVCEMEQPITAGSVVLLGVLLKELCEISFHYFSYSFPAERLIIHAYMERVKKDLVECYEEAHMISRKVQAALAQSSKL